MLVRSLRSPATPTIRVATLNVRNMADRWLERSSLLVEQLVALRPDVIGLQEVRRFPDQAGWIAGQVNATIGPGEAAYQVHRTYKTGWWGLWEGIAVLARLPILERSWLDLRAQHRVAQRVLVGLPEGGVLAFHNTHLSPRDEELRASQAGRVLAWMSEGPEMAQVLVGDLNAQPGSPTIKLLEERLRSAYSAVHGSEPPRTYPTPLRGEPSGRGIVVDYVLVNELVDVEDASVTFDRADADDPRLVASDHYGVAATLSVRQA